MAKLPYTTSSGIVEKALVALKAAAVPERVTQDFVKTILKIPGGSGDQITTFLKKINFASSDGTPTELYTKFRNPSSSGPAMAKAIRHAYAPLYIRSEFMHELADDDLVGLIVEETGLAHDSNPVKMAFNCIKALKKYANFDEHDEVSENPVAEPQFKEPQVESVAPPRYTANMNPGKSFGLNLGYTINLNLPATTDPAVFNAIFKSLKENLLSDEDA